MAADIGCGRGYIAQHVYKDMISLLFQCDTAELLLVDYILASSVLNHSLNVLSLVGFFAIMFQKQAKVSPEVPTITFQADEEFLPFRPGSLDLAVTSLRSLSVSNYLIRQFRQFGFFLVINMHLKYNMMVSVTIGSMTYQLPLSR